MRNKILFFLLLTVISNGFGQSIPKKIALTDILQAIEKEFNVKFSYAVEDVAIVFIEKPDSKLNLKETITDLNRKTLLNFQALNARYITVSVINKTISVCGTVFSEDSEIPLTSATISSNDGKINSISDENGEFKIQNIPLNTQLIISYLGFESREFSASELFSDKSSCTKIILSPKNEILNQVVISKFLTTGLESRMDGSTVLNTKKFGILPGLVEPDILQMIQALPGVESNNESIANINVRGGTNDQNLMLWDNIKMYHSGHFFGLISAYNPNITNKVVVSKNGTSAEFSDGVSSTINMSTNDVITNTFSGGGGMNLISADAFLEIPISKKLELHISGRRSFTDVFKSPTYSNYFNRSFQDSEIRTNQGNTDQIESASNFYFYDFTAKLLFDLNDKHHFRFNMININNNLDYSERLLSSSNQSDTKSSNLTQRNSGYGGDWKAIWNSKLTSNISAYYSKYTINSMDYRLESDQNLRQENEVLQTGIKINALYKLNPNLNLLFGYQVNETGMLNQTTVSLPSYERTRKDVLLDQALYLESEYQYNGTYIRAGLRVNYFQKFDKVLVEPRINIRQELSKLVALKFEGELKNQTTTQVIDFQDDFLGVEKRRWVLVNNKDIPIAISQQASFGIGLRPRNLSIDLTGFYKKVDGITARNQGFYNNLQFINTNGSYTVEGLEFIANKTARKYSAWISYTYSVNNYEFNAFTSSKFPNNLDLRHSVSMAFNYNLSGNLKLSFGGIWHTGQPYTSPVEGNETVRNGNNTAINYNAPNSENLDSFMRLDASVYYNFKVSKSLKASLRAGIINFTNENNTINRYYIVNPNNTTQVIQRDNKSIGLTPNISLRLNF